MGHLCFHLHVLFNNLLDCSCKFFHFCFQTLILRNIIVLILTWFLSLTLHRKLAWSLVSFLACFSVAFSFTLFCDMFEFTLVLVPAVPCVLESTQNVFVCHFRSHIWSMKFDLAQFVWGIYSSTIWSVLMETPHDKWSVIFVPCPPEWSRCWFSLAEANRALATICH